MSKSGLLSTSEENLLESKGYRLLQKLGEGSYAPVYLTEYGLTNKDKRQKGKFLACKIIDTKNAPKDYVKKFLPRELEILVRMNHPHIIHIQCIFQRKSKYFVFMRNAENGDLLDYILKNGPISEARSRVWFRQLCLAIQYLQTMDIAHRDLKCENALISENFNLKLADFGFARFVTDGFGQKIYSKTYCGSLSYAAPEILKGMPYDPKISDIWSLGVMLYVMVNKAMPFDDHNVKKLYENQVSKHWKFRSKVVDNLSLELKELVKRLLEPDIKLRYQVDAIINSTWIKMDARLMTLTYPEEMALAEARIQRREFAIISRRQSKIRKSKFVDEVKVFKPAVRDEAKTKRFDSSEEETISIK